MRLEASVVDSDGRCLTSGSGLWSVNKACLVHQSSSYLGSSVLQFCIIADIIDRVQLGNYFQVAAVCVNVH
uniref:LCCL domain-containing protein n=1 Tax=Mesocestoides corti TaxID=53468 RepID=A0A5K3FUL3_MESCO